MSTGYSLFGAYAQDEGNNLGLGTIYNFAGAGVTATISGSTVTVTIPGGGGGGGAPVNAQYLTLAADATLTQERVFAPSANFLVVDGGAGGNYSLDLSNTTVAAGSYTYASITVDAKGRLTSASSGAAPVASGWTDGGTTVYLTTSTDVVSIGNNAGVTNRKLSVYNTGTDLGASVVTLASSDNVLSTFVSGEANSRYSVNGAGATVWGAGGASAPDLRLQRSASGALQLDNNAGGSAFFIPVADSLGNIGAANVRWVNIIGNTHAVYAAAGDLNASATLASQSLRLGVGGATALDTRLQRTAAATVTVDNNAGGSATLRVLGTTNTQQRIHGATSKAVADSPYTTLATDEVVFWNCVGGNCTQNLPTPVGALGRTLIVKRVDTSANTLTLTPAAGQVEGLASLVVAGGASRASITLMSDNSNWWVI